MGNFYGITSAKIMDVVLVSECEQHGRHEVPSGRREVFFYGADGGYGILNPVGTVDPLAVWPAWQLS